MNSFRSPLYLFLISLLFPGCNKNDDPKIDNEYRYEKTITLPKISAALTALRSR